jgi:hypothetical protein
MITLHEIETLKEKHASLKQAINRESARPHPDDTAILSLKKKKLQIKDQLHQLSTSPSH